MKTEGGCLFFSKSPSLCSCGIASALWQEAEMCFPAFFFLVIPHKWRESTGKYRVSNAFSVMIKTSHGYSTPSEKSFRTEIWGLMLDYSQDAIKANTISHPVVLRAEYHLEGKFVTYGGPSLTSEGSSKLFWMFWFLKLERRKGPLSCGFGTSIFWASLIQTNCSAP